MLPAQLSFISLAALGQCFSQIPFQLLLLSGIENDASLTQRLENMFRGITAQHMLPCCRHLDCFLFQLLCIGLRLITKLFVLFVYGLLNKLEFIQQDLVLLFGLIHLPLKRLLFGGQLPQLSYCPKSPKLVILLTIKFT